MSFRQRFKTKSKTEFMINGESIMSKTKKVILTAASMTAAATAVAAGSGTPVHAAPSAGASAKLAATVDEADSKAQEQIAAINEQLQKTYGNVGIASTDSYIEVKASPDDNADYTGKLYNGNEATVLSEDGDWYQIQSGDVNGYVHKDVLTVGDPETAMNAQVTLATINADALRVRAEASLTGKILNVVNSGTVLTVAADDPSNPTPDGWIHVTYNNQDAYISADYATTSTTYTYGETRKAEAARITAEQAAQEAAQKSAQREGVINYASQFLGNRYVYGGTSLTHGVDCSGFVMQVYAHFGVSLPHSSAADRSVGYGVSVNDIQVGDIVCYAGHVGLYAGNGQIISASNPSSGIKYSPLHYRPIVAVRRIF